MPVDVRDAVEHAVTSGVHNVFLWASAFTLLAIVAAWFIRETPLRGGAADQSAPEDRALTEPVTV